MKQSRFKNSLLYKITGNGIKKPSYLLGTMHITCAKDFHLHEKALRALNKCSIYYMEVDMGNAQQLQMMEQHPSSIPDIYEGLSDSEKEELNDILQNHFGLSPDEAKELPPVSLIHRMTLEAIDCDDIRMVETELLKIAQAKGLQTAGLETATGQLNIAQKVFTGKEILWQLRYADAYKDLFAKMVQAYHSENLQELTKLVTDQRFMSKRAYNILVINRNKRWAKIIPSLIAAQSAFIAFGAGHLPGEQGVLKLLSQQGYSVNPVYV